MSLFSIYVLHKLIFLRPQEVSDLPKLGVFYGEKTLKKRELLLYHKNTDGFEIIQRRWEWGQGGRGLPLHASYGFDHKVIMYLSRLLANHCVYRAQIKDYLDQ